LIYTKNIRKRLRNRRNKRKTFDVWRYQKWSLFLFFILKSNSNCNAGISFHSVMQNIFKFFFRRKKSVYSIKHKSSFKNMKELIYNILLMYKQLLAPKELQIYNIKFILTTKRIRLTTKMRRILLFSFILIFALKKRKSCPF